MPTWQSFSFYMPNALPEIVAMQGAVFAALNEPLTQVRDTCQHGEFLTRTLRENADRLDAVVFYDLDCIPLKRGVTARAVDLALRRGTIIGCAQQAEHVEIMRSVEAERHLPFWHHRYRQVRRRVMDRLGRDPFRFDDPFIYAGPCFLVVPTKLYKAVGQPDLMPTASVDVAGALTAACRERGVPVRCLQPTYCHHPKYKLGNTPRYGPGTVYGNCVFHAFETTYLTNTKSASLFMEYGEKVVRQQGRQLPSQQGGLPA